MLWAILILLVLAALFGVLAAVVKAVAFIILTILLTITVFAALGWWALKRQVRKVADQLDAQSAERPVAGRDRQDGELPPPRDDRY
jgi:cobalamin biosynthesis protein CobD/CbiB